MEWGGRARAYIRPRRGHLPTAELNSRQKKARTAADGGTGDHLANTAPRARACAPCCGIGGGRASFADLLGRSPAPVLRHATHYAAAQRRKRGPRTPRKLK